MQEHGSFELQIKGKTLISKAYGAWNYETSVRYATECRQLIEQHLLSESWASIVDLSDWELATPDIWQVIDELNIWASENNLKHEVVIPSLTLQQTLLEQTQEGFTDVETKFVDNIAQAYQWLEQLGYLPAH
jgi:hypothetical protein